MKLKLAMLTLFTVLNPLSYSAARADDTQTDQKKVYIDVDQIDEKDDKIVVELPEGIFEADVICKDASGYFVNISDLKPVVDEAIADVEEIIEEAADKATRAVKAGIDSVESML